MFFFTGVSSISFTLLLSQTGHVDLSSQYEFATALGLTKPDVQQALSKIYTRKNRAKTQSLNKNNNNNNNNINNASNNTNQHNNEEVQALEWITFYCNGYRFHRDNQDLVFNTAYSVSCLEKITNYRQDIDYDHFDPPKITIQISDAI